MLTNVFKMFILYLLFATCV